MKERNRILIPGIIAIIILISVQVFIIRGIWKQKEEMFSLRYTLGSQEALAFIQRRLPTDGFDTVRLLLRSYSEGANKEIHEIKDPQELKLKKEEVLAYFKQVVIQEQYLSNLLSSYFERRGYEKNFNFSIEIINLEMIAGNTGDTVVVYRRNGGFRSRSAIQNTAPGILQNTRSRILVNWFGMEDNNYRFLFEYYIDYSDKRSLLLKEMTTSLLLSTSSILIVVIIFMFTYRNLMEEKRLSDLKTDFINNMTHELKTPLSTITVAGRTLEMHQIRTNEDKILETARMIGKQSVHLNQLINMILEISMWERTQFQLDKKITDVEEVMNDIIDSFKSGSGDSVSISRKYLFNGAKADLDVVYFTTMINNLLSNAVKYSNRDPVINIEGYSTNEHIRIKVSDNGIGISKTDQKHIFDKFYRASTGNIHKFKGLGLGLYYVKKIAVAHGGDVTVTSKPGKGSTFAITIPHN
jgi:signal transduction histidine kinase